MTDRFLLLIEGITVTVILVMVSMAVITAMIRSSDPAQQAYGWTIFAFLLIFVTVFGARISMSVARFVRTLDKQADSKPE